MIKKVIIFALVILALIYAARFLDRKLSQDFFSGYGVESTSASTNEPTVWDNIKDWFADLFGDKEEKFIYR